MPSLDQVLNNTSEGTVELLRNQQSGPKAYPGVPAEYTNWRDEQQAWQNSCILFNQSYHMVDLEVTGPDAYKMLNYLGIKSYKGVEVDKAKKFVPCTPEGYVTGDVILFYLAENEFNLVGRAPVIEWVEYHAQTGEWDGSVKHDERTVLRKDTTTRKYYRFSIHGPNALTVIEKATDATLPDLNCCTITNIPIAGKTARTLHLGLASPHGFDAIGPWSHG